MKVVNTIYGVPVAVNSELPFSEMKKIIKELVAEWTWNGRQLGRVEMISDGQFVQVCAYEKPIVKVYKNGIGKGNHGPVEKTAMNLVET